MDSELYGGFLSLSDSSSDLLLFFDRLDDFLLGLARSLESLNDSLGSLAAALCASDLDCLLRVFLASLSESCESLDLNFGNLSSNG